MVCGKLLTESTGHLYQRGVNEIKQFSIPTPISNYIQLYM